MTSDMEGVKDDDFDGLLDKIEAKYCAKIMTLFGNQPEEKVDGFTGSLAISFQIILSSCCRQTQQMSFHRKPV